MIVPGIADFSAPRSRFSRVVCSIFPEGPASGGGVAGRQLKEIHRKPDRPEVIKSILIIDSDALALKGMRGFVEDLGFRVTVINPHLMNLGVQQTSEFVFKHGFDMILVGGRIGPRSGWAKAFYGATLVRTLRDAGYFGHLVANSGHPQENALMTEAGADLCLEDKGYFRLPDFFLP